MKEGWMENNESSRMNDEEWWFKAVEGFLWLTDERTDICECRVAFATENRALGSNKYTWQDISSYLMID